MVATPVSSGHSLGSCNWIIQSHFEKVNCSVTSGIKNQYYYLQWLDCKNIMRTFGIPNS